MASVTRINPASLRNLQAYVRDLPKKIRDVGSKTIRESAYAYYEALKSNIEEQKYAHTYPPLSPNWMKRKVDPRFWINHGHLLDGLVVRRVEMSSTERAYVVGFNNEEHRGKTKNKLTNAHLAWILEFGWGKIPPRPVVQDTWDENRKSIADTARKSFKTRWRHDKYRG